MRYNECDFITNSMSFWKFPFTIYIFIFSSFFAPEPFAPFLAPFLSFFSASGS
jgi:hypothetical protein